MYVMLQVITHLRSFHRYRYNHKEHDAELARVEPVRHLVGRLE